MTEWMEDRDKRQKHIYASGILRQMKTKNSLNLV